jgi:small subunit ribosomal protein S16
MAVRIRLSRIGTKHDPYFRIVAVDSRKKRDGAFLENLGTYNAIKTELVQFHEERINHWISLGAQPSDTVKKLHRMYKDGLAATAK